MKRALERRLADLAGFADPDADREQYATPADLAAHLVHTADLRDDLAGVVLDLGTGTGMLALAASLSGASPVVGLDVDPDALSVARENERRLDGDAPVSWLCGDATRPPLSLSPSRSRSRSDAEDVTVVMNPPFGAQHGNRHADRRFLATCADVAAVSWSIHNAGSRAFVESYAADRDAAVTDAFAAEFDVRRQFDFHAADRRTLDVEVYRIEWR